VSARGRRRLRLEDADKYLLYQWAVQEPEEEVGFLVEAYERRRGREPLILREDFCGTAAVAAAWVKSDPRRRAIGLDLDPEPLDWGRERNVRPLGEAAARIELLQADVRTETSPKADVICALNFSYYVFRPLAELAAYFAKARSSLAPGGIIVLDTYGGWESQQVKEEPRQVSVDAGRFTYVWHQAEYNPIDSRTVCHIHFELAGGACLREAFTYDWRLYTPAEVGDALLAAGFSNVEVYWDFEPAPDAPTDYRPARRAENRPGWLAYVVADGG
jgi:SAM-dependent methyltransferase